MQLYAIQGTRFVYIDDAARGVSYTCPDCGEEVRVRGGRYRISHYYHYKQRTRCNSGLKGSSIHIQIQKKILTLLPPGEAEMEYPFPLIGRIADLLWRKAGIVFEIQCSPITLMEVKRRERAYRRMGLRVVWVLADHRFNGKTPSPSERSVRLTSAFYAQVKSRRFTGLFYDQFQIYRGAWLLFKTPPSPIHLHRPLSLNPSGLPEFLLKRISFFSGDLVDRSLRSDTFKKILFEHQDAYKATGWAGFKNALGDELFLMGEYLTRCLKGIALKPEEIDKDAQRKDGLNPYFKREEALES